MQMTLICRIVDRQSRKLPIGQNRALFSDFNNIVVSQEWTVIVCNCLSDFLRKVIIFVNIC